MNNDCKLLSPVGSMEVLKASVFSGADYVYLSGKMYGARDYANNFTHKQLEEAVEFCHNFNVGVFVTVNTSILESEIIDAIDYVYFLYTQGVDAVIVEDIGLASLIHELMPSMDLHASTQMTVYDYSMVKYLYDNGFVNANISREVPIERIRTIVEKLRKYDYDIKIEAFAHGALCYSYSGRCLMSSFLGGRSGNRGLCAQPCRMRYALLDKYHGIITSDKYLLSTKDLSTYNDVKKLVDCGVDCLKIEGRMKSSEYVSVVTHAYKNAIAGKINKEDNFLLNLAFNRSLTGGYILGNDPSEVVGRVQAGSIGYPIGVVTKSNSKKITIKLLDKNHQLKFVNGDGLKFVYESKSYGMYITRIFDQNKYKIIIANEKNIFLNEGTLVYITYSKYLEDKSREIINKKHVHKIPLHLEINVNNQRQLEVKCRMSKSKKSFFYTSKESFEIAQNRPLSKKSFEKQLKKTGKSKFLIESIIYKNFPDDLFMPISSLNDIRRKLLKKVKEELDTFYIPTREDKKNAKMKIEKFKNDYYNDEKTVKNKETHKKNRTWNVYISNLKQAEIIRDYSFVDSIYFDASYNYHSMHEYVRDIYDRIYELKKIISDYTDIVWVLPQLLPDKQLGHISEILVKLEFEKIDVKVQTDSVGIAYTLDEVSYGNYLNIYNNYSIKKLSRNNLFERLVLSNEISLEDIRRLDSEDCKLEYIIFGYTQVMISKDDFEDVIDKRRSNHYYLKDKRDNEYPLVFDCNQNSHIYDYRIANLADRLDELEKTNIDTFSIDLRHFNNTDTRRVMDFFNDILRGRKHDELKLSQNNNFYELNIQKGLFINKNK